MQTGEELQKSADPTTKYGPVLGTVHDKRKIGNVRVATCIQNSIVHQTALFHMEASSGNNIYCVC